MTVNWNLMWGIPSKKKELQERKIPEKCVFCTKPIEEDDFYYLGYTRGHIYAETCDRYDCTKWLEQKSHRLRKR